MPRPQGFAEHDPHVSAVYDWLALNDVDEVLPEHAAIVVNGDTMSITTFDWMPGWVDRWDVDGMIVDSRTNDPRTATRFVPCKVRPDAAVRAAARAAGGSIVG